MPEEIEKEENIIKKVCREYSLTYKKLAEELGYSEGSIANSARKENNDLPLNVKRSIELFYENIEYKKKFDEFQLFKSLLHSLILKA